MNRSESKYFNTALCMDEALIALLGQKDLEYITVKEICEKAGVNRSTFYLHYETIADLANEAVETVSRRFLAHFSQSDTRPPVQIESSAREELIFINTDYLLPYLEFVRKNKNVYRAAFKSPHGTQVQSQYKRLLDNVLRPVMRRFQIPEELSKYYISYYMQGLGAIIHEWLDRDCKESIDTIATIIIQCIRPPEINDEQQN